MAAPLVIDKGVPIPEPWLGKRTGLTGAIRVMEVGDSVFVEGRKSRGHYAWAYRCTCRKFATRRVTESGVYGTRIWRIK